MKNNDNGPNRTLPLFKDFIKNDCDRILNPMPDTEMTRSGYTKGELKEVLFPKIEITDDMRDSKTKIKFPDRLRKELLKEQRLRHTRNQKEWMNQLNNPHWYIVGQEQWFEWLEVMNENPSNYKDILKLSDWNAYILEEHTVKGDYDRCTTLTALCILMSGFRNWFTNFERLQDYEYEPILYELEQVSKVFSRRASQYYYLSLKGVAPPQYVTSRIDFSLDVWNKFRAGTLKKSE